MKFLKFQKLGVIILAALLAVLSGCQNVSNNHPQKSNIEYGAAVSESPLSNTYKLLTNGDKKLTIGYIGGSITFGSSAKTILKNGYPLSSDGNILDSWVNRVSSFFSEKYPEATIQTVNAGICDTATNFGLFRLKNTLMNENGHDMPDLVFVEFTTNDWIYKTQSVEDLKVQIESLFRNIREINPYAEIIAISTTTGNKDASRLAYKEICEYYGIPFIDVGVPLQRLKKKQGNREESSGNYYYTIDNLHPSALGYEAYFNEIKPVLEANLDNLALQSNKIYDYNANLPVAISDKLIDNPTIITADKLMVTGSGTIINESVIGGMYGTELYQTDAQLAPSYILIKGGTTVAASFSGNVFGLMFKMTTSDIAMQYRIDGGEWKEFGINDSFYGFQRYSHPQVFMLEHNLSDSEHTVELKFTAQNSDNVCLGGILVNE